MTTNYRNAFIAIAPDCAAQAPETPPHDPDRPSIAALQFALLSDHPYEMTSDDLIFAVHALRTGLARPERERARHQYFAQDRACLRASPLSKRYGWGTHHDDDGRVALYGVGTPDYERLLHRGALKQTRALRSSRT